MALCYRESQTEVFGWSVKMSEMSLQMLQKNTAYTHRETQSKHVNILT